MGRPAPQLVVVGESKGPSRSRWRRILDRVAPQKRAPEDVTPEGGRFILRSFTNAAGSRPYKLYIPDGYKGASRPLIVMLHGCKQSADDFAAGTAMNACAQEHKCFVAYPEQIGAANPSRCWNWFKPAHQLRDQGEPSIIAGITREVMKEYPIDPRKIYIAGLSAGGAAAAVMGEAYPDLYAAVGIHSGLAYGAASDIASAFAAMSGKGRPRAEKASAKAGAGAFVPTIVFHGDNDATVHPSNGADVIARAAAFGKLQSLTENATAAGRSYARSVHRDKKGRAVIEEWVIHGAGHAWSGGNASGSFADPSGPNATREMMRFFLALTLSTR